MLLDMRLYIDLTGRRKAALGNINLKATPNFYLETKSGF